VVGEVGHLARVPGLDPVSESSIVAIYWQSLGDPSQFETVSPRSLEDFVGPKCHGVLGSLSFDLRVFPDISRNQLSADAQLQ
jgi:hypothetical protein